jgi:hypothetical protein
MLAAAPVALPALAALAQQPTAKPSALASCIAASDASLTGDERARLEKAIGSLEQALETIRNFDLPPGAGPALRFTALKSARSI